MTAVALSTRFALVIMVQLFPYLAVRYGVGDVPSTVVNGRVTVVGPRDEDAYLDEVLGPAGRRTMDA